MKRLAILFVAVLLFSIACARDSLKKHQQEQSQPLEMRIRLNFKGQIDPNQYYFIVFNILAQSENNLPNEEPKPVVSGLDRARNWTDYIVYTNSDGDVFDMFFKRKTNLSDLTPEQFNTIPSPLETTSFNFFISKEVSGSSISVVIDLNRFLDRDGDGVRDIGGFLVNFFTATTGVDVVSNPSDLGLTYDALNEGLLVTADRGFNKNETNTRKETPETELNPPASVDLASWSIEIF